MANRLAPVLLAVVVGAGAPLVGTAPVNAQERNPSLPPAPLPTPRLPPGAPGGSGNYVVSAAANERGAFLWVVDSIQHVVTLCEKTESKDFSCSKKPLP